MYNDNLDLDDFEPGYAEPLSARELAHNVKAALDAGNSKEAWRWMMQLLDDFRSCVARGEMPPIAERPEIIGDQRYDAAIAALVEHLCASASMAIPRWTGEPERFCEPWWFVAELPGYRWSALRDSPISFKRHGVFITKRGLDRV
jgi:hypothetical protein